MSTAAPNTTLSQRAVETKSEVSEWLSSAPEGRFRVIAWKSDPEANPTTLPPSPQFTPTWALSLTVLPALNLSDNSSTTDTMEVAWMPPGETGAPAVDAAFNGGASYFFYSHLLGSTQDLLGHTGWIWNKEGILSVSGLHAVAMADAQSAGRGRGSNTWVSPAGGLALSFTAGLAIEASARLPQFQYLVCMAVIRAVGAAIGPKLAAVKWPNDIYTANGDAKLGGILCSSTCLGAGSGPRSFMLISGIGLNVNTPLDVTPASLASTSGSQDKLTVADVGAALVTALSDLVPEYQSVGFGGLIDEYLACWLHTGQKVKVTRPGEVDRDVVVMGLTPGGFLSAADVETGEKFELSPDGNSFDFWANLIYKKVS